MMSRRYAFDVGSTLGIGTPDPSPLPEANKKVILLRVSAGFSLLSLRDSAAGRGSLLHRQNWYEKFYWSRKKVHPGVYQLRIPVPGSPNLSFVEQQQLLYEEEAVAPVAAVLAALLCMKQAGQLDPLAGRWTRCVETASAAGRVGLCWGVERLFVSASWVVNRNDAYVGLSSLRRIS